MRGTITLRNALGLRGRARLGASLALFASIVAAMPAIAHPHDVVVATPYGYRAIVVGRPGWWRHEPAFVDYAGPRPGFYFAPGYGYYPVPPVFARATWRAGVILPPPLRRYVVVQPAVYGLAPAPIGYGWYYAGNRFVLAAIATGLITRAVVGGW